MLRSWLILFLCASFCSCIRDNKIDTVEKSLIWPLKKGNTWVYRGISGYADGGSNDTTSLVLEADSSMYVDGNEFMSLKGDYEHWYRSAKAEVWMSNTDGSQVRPIARNTGSSVVISEETGTFNYFMGAATFTGTLTRTTDPSIIAIRDYICTSTIEEYKNESGTVVQKRIVYYSSNKGPICFKYYCNRESPGSGDIYQALVYTIEDITLL
ncbi:MAG: hypothetical protein JNL72_11390 [Flavipsychrobacter sp.]|nr:hypothetical protein [Flavipsychrobacter sp.]